MRYLLILVFFVSFNLLSKSITIIPILPEGYSLLESFKPETELEKHAFEAVESYLVKNNDAVWNYYLSKGKLNVPKAVYEFQVKHDSEYTKKPYVKSYLSGTFFYNVKNKSVRFVRESQLNKALKQDK